jgi:ATP-dependent exoDNAse (exonuclease V) beta subunit
MPEKQTHHFDSVSARGRRLIGAEVERCIYCGGTKISKEGKRYKKLETVQLWYCRTCDRVFTPQRAKGRSYPLKVILEALMLYYQGETRARVSLLIKDRFGITLPERTLSTWLSEYRPLTTYARLRSMHSQRSSLRRLVRVARLHHQQVYSYRIHTGKLVSSFEVSGHERLKPAADFLTQMAEDCPHHLFQASARASEGSATFDLDAVEIKAKRNHACRVAGLVLQAVASNKQRHDELQRFMLATDSVTVAVEVPVFLYPEDLQALKATPGFDIPLAVDQTLTGHIDILQVRNGAIHLLDYKPKARLEKPIPQLMTYALALSRRTGLRLFDIVCAWFDEEDYFEFYPLHVVHKRGRGAS